MRYILLFSFLLVSFLKSGAQSSYHALDMAIEDSTGSSQWPISVENTMIQLNFAPVRIPFDAYTPFLAVNVEWVSAQVTEPGRVAVSIRFWNEKQGWGDWLPASYDPHTGDGKTRFFTNLMFEEKQHQQVQVRMEIAAGVLPVQMAKARLFLFNPGPTIPLDYPLTPLVDLRDSPCSCMTPMMTAREQWCPDGSCLPHPSPETTIPTHLIIHHSAGSNVSSDWAAVVRSIWNYHVNSNGWSDIGYNWLVDPNGTIYIGRGDRILGAHFCGKNGETLGTCMLGDFTTVTPTEEALSALEKLLAWKVCDEVLHPLEEAYHVSSAMILANISGHRDACNTSCPGDAFYPLLPEVRHDVLSYLRQSCACNLVEPTFVEGVAQPGGVTLGWTYAEAGITFFIERKGPMDSGFMVIDSTTLQTYTDQTITAGENYIYRISATNGWCLSTVSGEVSVRAQQMSEFMIQPTLVQNELTLSVQNDRSEPVDVRIYAFDGRLMWQREYSKAGMNLSVVLNIQTFPSGRYVLQMRQGDSQKSTTLTKVE